MTRKETAFDRHKEVAIDHLEASKVHLEIMKKWDFHEWTRMQELFDVVRNAIVYTDKETKP